MLLLIALMCLPARLASAQNHQDRNAFERSLISPPEHRQSIFHPFGLMVGVRPSRIPARRRKFISNPDKFYAAAPYTFLVASLIVLVFGPGKLAHVCSLRSLRDNGFDGVPGGSSRSLAGAWSWHRWRPRQI